MIPNEPARVLSSSVTEASGIFGISRVDEAHLMTILRDSMYTDRILAVLREYGANAWDAHRDAGKADVPIKVTLPTDAEPTLAIRDYGTGMSQEDVFTVYTQYGASTKRGTDVAVGMLGIGSKSAFAYADAFTVTSWHAGEKRVYAAALDVTNKGVMTLLHTEPCGDETGVEIKLAIKREDRWEFENKAISLYKYFNPRPVINIALPPPLGGPQLKNGRIWQGFEGWVAVMGCIAYRVNLHQLGDSILPALKSHHGELFFNIGEVTISASREELRYTKETNAAIAQKFADLVDEHIATTLAAIKSTTGSAWERRLKAQTLRGLLSAVPAEDHGLLAAHIPTEGKIPAKCSLLTGSSKNATNVSVDHTARIVFRDTRKRSLKGYSLDRHSYVFDGKREALDGFIAAMGIEGIPVVLLSTLPWTRTSNRASEPLAQHKQSCFVLNVPEGGRTLAANGAINWTGVSRVPQDTDVFVVLREFKVPGHSCFGYSVNADRRLAALLKVPFPPVYGYKTTSAKPVVRGDCKGTEYTVWRAAFIQSQITPEIVEQATRFAIAEAFEGKEKAWDFGHGFQHAWGEISATLGAKHPVVEVLGHYAVGRDHNRIEDALKELYAAAERQITVDVEAPAARAAELLLKYPLLRKWNSVWRDQTRLAAWLEYIKLKDAHELSVHPHQ